MIHRIEKGKILSTFTQLVQNSDELQISWDKKY